MVDECGGKNGNTILSIYWLLVKVKSKSGTISNSKFLYFE